MSNAVFSAANAKAEQMHAVVKSIREFDKLKLAGIISAIINPTDRDNCFLGTYYRTVPNVDSLLALNNSTHFQAAAMLSRSLFELAIDIKLIDKIPAGWLKMVFFVEIEKLRSARKMVDFARSNPSRTFDISSQTEFIAKNGARIDQNHRTLWPSKKPNTKVSDLKHWSAKDLSQRAALLGDPFDEMYNSHYPRLSWYVHSGLTGVLNLPSDFFPTVHGFALSLCMSCYSHILESVIHEFKIHLADDKIHKTLKYATLLPFTETPEDEARLFHELLR
jgi:hypothetical protein